MRFVPIVVASLLSAGLVCKAEPLVPSGKTITLRPGESVVANDAGLRVGFDGVTRDSRCPKGEQCVWAGDATIRIWLQSGAGTREPRELHTSTVGPQSRDGETAGDVRVLRLEPSPVAGRRTAAGDYVLTLTIGPVDSGNPER